MTATAAGTPPSARQRDKDARAGLLIRLADDDLLTGHVLTSVAGWGPELEINIALSSMGQDEIGHARRLYALVIADRAAIERFVYERPATDFRASPLARTYPTQWEALLARQYLYETAEAARAAALGGTGDGELAALFHEMGHEQRYHLDFWSTWLKTTSGRSAAARRRVRSSLGQMWPLATASFLPGRPDAVEAALGLPGGVLEAAQCAWASSVQEECGQLGFELRDGPADPALGRLDVMLEEMRYVYKTAPGSW
ncbi:MAG: Phenylacetic acid catabolic protein [Streptosporangiaceae bacterium]